MTQLFSHRICLCHCLCICLCLCICVPNSFLNSYYHKLSENVWVWGCGATRSEIWTSVTIAGRTNNQPTRKDRATQPMDHRRLRWAKMGILAHISLTVLNFSNVVKVNTNNHQHCIDKGSYQSEQKVWSKLLSHSSSRAFMVKKFQWRVDFIFEKHPTLRYIRISFEGACGHK